MLKIDGALELLLAGVERPLLLGRQLLFPPDAAVRISPHSQKVSIQCPWSRTFPPGRTPSAPSCVGCRRRHRRFDRRLNSC